MWRSCFNLYFNLYFTHDVSIVTIKKFCDGLDISLKDFFNTEEVEKLEQEIKKKKRFLIN